MKLFTKEIDKKLFEQYSKGNDLENQMVVAKIFNPYGRGTWYLLNSDPEDPDYVWAIVNLFEVETGSISRNELESIKVPPFRLGLERDLSWTPKPAMEVLKGLQDGKYFAKGGGLDYFPKYNLNKEGNFSATINGKSYEIIYRDDISQMYDLFENGIKIASDRSLRNLMSFDKYAKGGGIVENKKALTLYRFESLKKGKRDILTDKENNLYIYEDEILYDTEDGIKRGTSHRMSKINLTILPFTEYEHGGGIEDENREMVLNENKQIKHHTEELPNAIKGKKVPAWVVAKVHESASDLSDATHYMDGEKMAKGGGLKDNMIESLVLIFKDEKQFEKAKEHFENNSGFYPNDINEEFRAFYFSVQDQDDADSTEYYLEQELQETDLTNYYFSSEDGFYNKMAKGGGVGEESGWKHKRKK